ARAAAESPLHGGIMARMTLILSDAPEILPSLKPETVLIDPMHPPRGKSALVKAEMRQLRDLVGSDPDCAELMRVALACTSKRVVLKWPRRAALLTGLPEHTHQHVGNSTHYEGFIQLPTLAYSSSIP